MPFTSDDSAVSADAVAGSGGLSESPGRVSAGPTALDWRPISPVAMSADQVAREIDRVLSDVWRKQGIKPAAPAGKANLMRRLYLDLTGRIPTVSEVRDLHERLAMGESHQQLTERLLRSGDHASHIAAVWRTFLLPKGEWRALVHCCSMPPRI